MSAFLIDFLWYLVAFAVGALVAWGFARATIKATSADEAFADLPGAREMGDRR